MEMSSEGNQKKLGEKRLIITLVRKKMMGEPPLYRHQILHE